MRTGFPAVDVITSLLVANAAQAALRGREIAYLADPLDALALQIQGSGRLRVVEPDGSLLPAGSEFTEAAAVR